MHYSLIIPAWNEASYLEHTLISVVAAMQQIKDQGVHSGELIVVDNNSTDATAAIASDCGATVVFEPVNQIARARNRGAEAAEGNALIFLDADTTCSARLLSHVLAALESGQVVGGGSVIAPDKPVAAAAMRGIRLWNWIARTGRLAAGCFVYCRRDAFDAVGGFSDRVYAGEEIFLSRQLKKWGREHRMRFEIVDVAPVVTSVRKLDWYSPMQLARQAVLILIPGAVFSKRLCKTWYDTDARRK